MVDILGHACELREQLGAGGMGTVFAVDHPSAGPLAVKLLQDSLRDDHILHDQMRSEGRIAAQIDHPNVVRIVDYGETCDGRPFVAMRRLTGTPLGSLVQTEGPLALGRIRSIAAQLCDGLEAIHARGFVHADLKSDNLLLDVAAGDRLSIIDFGLARPPHTRLRDDERSISGTPEYMAPEVIRGEPFTMAADIYAIAIILYELVTGSTPFGGGSTTEIFTRHLDDDVVPPSLRCPDRLIPPALDAAILRALAKDPQARPHTIRELRDAVRAAISETDSVPAPSIHQPVFTRSAPTLRWTRSKLALGEAKTVVDAVSIAPCTWSATARSPRLHRSSTALQSRAPSHRDARDAGRAPGRDRRDAAHEPAFTTTAPTRAWTPLTPQRVPDRRAGAIMR